MAVAVKGPVGAAPTPPAGATADKSDFKAFPPHGLKLAAAPPPPPATLSSKVLLTKEDRHSTPDTAATTSGNFSVVLTRHPSLDTRQSTPATPPVGDPCGLWKKLSESFD